MFRAASFLFTGRNRIGIYRLDKLGVADVERQRQLSRGWLNIAKR